jgi:hypothetical protein
MCIPGGSPIAYATLVAKLFLANQTPPWSVAPYGFMVGWNSGGLPYVQWAETSSTFTSMSSASIQYITGQPNHVVVTWDGTYMRLYINGNIAATSSSTTFVWAGVSHGKWVLGNGGGYGGANFQSVRIHNVVLSAATIAANAAKVLAIGS